jgi:hypothetical protein
MAGAVKSQIVETEFKDTDKWHYLELEPSEPSGRYTAPVEMYLRKKTTVTGTSMCYEIAPENARESSLPCKSIILRCPAHLFNQEIAEIDSLSPKPKAKEHSMGDVTIQQGDAIRVV